MYSSSPNNLDKDRIKKSIPLILLIITVFSVGYWFFFSRHFESTDNAYVKSDIVVIRPRVSGYITQVMVSDNSEVKEGDVVAVIDQRDYLARLTKAEANAALSKTRTEVIKQQIDLQKDNIARAKANIDSVTATLKRADNDFARVNNLVKTGNASQQRLDVANESYKSANADFIGKTLELASAEKQLQILEKQQEESQEELNIANADLELARIDLENTEIKAKFNGFIAKSVLRKGQLVQPGTALGYLVSKDKIWIEANFKETQVKKMATGQMAVVEIDSFKGNKLYGKIESIAPAAGSEFSMLPAENATGNFTKVVQRVPVKIILDEPLPAMKSGMSAYVKVRAR